jgi:hypothetical protein
VTIPIESTLHAPVHLLRFGAEAEVLSPPELRQEIAAAVAGLAEMYRAG